MAELNSDVIELRRVFQDEAVSFVPTADQMLAANGGGSWSCTAYDVNDEKSKVWTLKFTPFTPGKLSRTDSQGNYQTFSTNPNYWLAPKRSTPDSNMSLYVRAFKFDPTKEDVSLIVEHTIVGAENYVTRPTYDASGQKITADSAVTSAVMAYSVCRSVSKAVE